MLPRHFTSATIGNELPGISCRPRSLCLVFDAAINSGTNRAAHWLQLVAQVPQDGVIGEQTVHAIDRTAARQGGIVDLCSEFLALRLVFMTSLPTWKTFGIGWSRRLCRLPYEAADAGYLDR